MRAGLYPVICLLALALGAAQVAYATAYSVTDLEAMPGGWQVWPQRLNNAGAAVGTCAVSGTLGDYYHAFLSTSGSMTDIGTFGGDNSWAYGINDAGIVVGSAETTDWYFDEYGMFRNCTHAFFWQNGVKTDIGTLGGNNSWAYAVNSLGYAVGWSETGLYDINAHPITHACAWINGGVVDLNDTILSGSGWELTSASGISDSGMIIGGGLYNGAPSAFIYDLMGGSVMEISALSGTPVYPYALNSAASAVGATYADSNNYAFRWDTTGGTQGLISIPGYLYTKASSINDVGRIVGQATSADQLSQTAVLWSGGGANSLNAFVSPVYQLTDAVSINNAGQILASADGRAYLLDLMPESAANAKKTPDGFDVKLGQMVVTAAFMDDFYIEDDSRVSGIRVHKPVHGLSVGARADIAGTIMTNINDERYIEAVSASPNGGGHIDPLALNNRMLGGLNCSYDNVTGAGQKGVKSGIGLNNIGLLIRTCGILIRNVDNSCSIDDGSGMYPKLQVPADISMPDPGKYVVVTGISSCWKDASGDLHPLVVLRSVDGIREITPGS